MNIQSGDNNLARMAEEMRSSLESTEMQLVKFRSIIVNRVSSTIRTDATPGKWDEVLKIPDHLLSIQNNLGRVKTDLHLVCSLLGLLPE